MAVDEAGSTAVQVARWAGPPRPRPPSAVQTVKQHLAAIRMLGDWLVVSQVLAPLGVAERCDHPIVDGEQVELGEAGQEPGRRTRRRDRRRARSVWSGVNVVAVLGGQTDGVRDGVRLELA